MRFLLTIIITICFNILQIKAQDFKIQEITAADGLAQGMVSHITQDRNGFLWFATGGGLEKYDGYHFQHFTSKQGDTTSLIENGVYYVFEDSKGRIWVTTYGGRVECFDPKTEKFHHLDYRIKKQNISANGSRTIHETSDGHIWIASKYHITELVVPDEFPSRDANIYHIQYKTFSAGKGLPVQPGTLLYSLLLPGGGIAIMAGVNIFLVFNTDTRSWEHHPFETAVKQGCRCETRPFVQRDGSIWMQRDGRLLGWKSGKVIVDAAMPLAGYQCNGNEMLYSNDQGDLWFTANSNLFFVSHNSLKTNNPVFKVVIPDGNCQTVFLDRQKRLWVGTNGFGIRTFLTIEPVVQNILPEISPMSIEAFQNDTILIRNAAGLRFIDGNGKLISNMSFLKVGSTVTSGCRTDKGTFFLRVKNFDGVFLYKFNHLSRDFVSSFRIPDNDNGSELLKCDRHNNIWVTFLNGKIGCLWAGTDTVQLYDYSNLWKGASVEIRTLNFYESANGSLWLCTSNGLVEMISGSRHLVKFRLWNNDNIRGLSNAVVLAALDDPAAPDKFLWVGTKGGGLNKMDKITGECTVYTTDNGLPDNVVYGILSDNMGNLWLSTNFGLSRFTVSKNYFRNYTAAEIGLQDNEFNTASFAKYPDGRMLFGGVKGISIINPVDFKPDSVFSPVCFTQLKINNHEISVRDSTGILRQPLQFTSKIYLKYDQNFLSLGFAALDFKQMGKSSYFYKMEGVDRDWVFADTKNEVSYPNLSPGTYTLYVANVNELGDRNPVPAKLVIVVAAPWWRSWAMYFIYLLIIIGLIRAYFRFQLHRASLQNELKFKEREALELQRLDEIKNRFFTNMVHEFRTPLTLIMEPARQLYERLKQPEDKTRAGIVVNNSNHLLQLINQLLDIAKLEDGKVHLHLVKGDLLVVLHEIFDYFQPLTQKKKQELIWESDFPNLYGIHDRQVLEKITYNLLSNAHKFSPEGSVIRLKVAQTDAHHWQLIVHNTGVSIADEELPFIFDRFYQADSSTTRRGEGTGIGLTLVKELVELTGGSLKVESTPAKGTIFAITLPLNLSGDFRDTNVLKSSFLANRPIDLSGSNTELNFSESPIAQENQQPIDTVLVVEDNTEMRQYLKMILEEDGFDVLEAADGAEGISKAVNYLPDLIISDVMMPEKDGFELTDTLKNHELTRHVPVILLTTINRLENKITGYRLGADAYIPKPFHSEELLVRIRQLLQVRKSMEYLKRQLTEKLALRLQEQPENPDFNDKGTDIKDFNQKTIFTHDDWRLFQEEYDSKFPGYIFSIKKSHPDLTGAELRLFLLLKLKVEPIDIANVIGISQGSVWRSRNRLAKKLGLTETKELDEYIFNY